MYLFSESTCAWCTQMIRQVSVNTLPSVSKFKIVNMLEGVKFRGFLPQRRVWHISPILFRKGCHHWEALQAFACMKCFYTVFTQIMICLANICILPIIILHMGQVCTKLYGFCLHLQNNLITAKTTIWQ